MRITGGSLRGRRLHVPRRGVRPTQDRLREALFSIVGDRIRGARVLDLFAGTGAVGLEAWSRGAASVCWVENDRQALAVLRRNVMELAPEAGRVVGADVERVLRSGRLDGPYGIVYADPPYGEGRGSRGEPRRLSLLERLGRGDVLSAGGWFVMEERAGGQAAAATGWRLLTERTYGATRLSIYEKEDAS